MSTDKPGKSQKKSKPSAKTAKAETKKAVTPARRAEVDAPAEGSTASPTGDSTASPVGDGTATPVAGPEPAVQATPVVGPDLAVQATPVVGPELAAPAPAAIPRPTATTRPRPAGARARPRTRAAVAGLSVVVVVLAGVLAFTAVRLHHAEARRTAQPDSVLAAQYRAAEAQLHAENSALAAAKAYALDLTTYNYQHLSTDFATVVKHSSPSFAATFTKSSNALRPVLVKYKATAKAAVLDAGVTSATAGRATVVVLLTQTVTNTAKKGSTAAQSRVSMSLTYKHGQWLIQQVTLL